MISEAVSWKDISPVHFHREKDVVESPPHPTHDTTSKIEEAGVTLARHI